MKKEITIPTDAFWDFGLYGREWEGIEDDEIDFEEKKDEIMKEFIANDFDDIQDILKKNGIHLKGAKYYSPKQYNYSNDSIDLVITVSDDELLEKFITGNIERVNKKLAENKSYDGYIALTSDSIKTAEDLTERDFTLVIELMLADYELETDIDNLTY